EGSPFRLPEQGESANFRSTVVIDLAAARKRLHGAVLADKRRPKILDTLDLADAWRRRLESGGVNQADLAREHGVSRARVTQVLALLRLHPEVLAWARANASSVSERRLRPLIRLDPRAQLRAVKGLRHL